jgi:serine/threonine protein kinase
MSRQYWKTLVGKKFNSKYHLVKFLNSGSSAGVFMADEVVQDRFVRQVAIKIFLTNNARLGQQISELQRATTLRHPHILECYSPELGFEENNETHEDREAYLGLTMELATESLEDYLKKQKKIPEEEVFKIAFQITSALVFLHKGNIVHRDLKPANVLHVGDSWKVGDLGISRLLTQGLATKTNPSQQIGTLAYQPPESYQGDIYPGWDIWSLGIMLQEMLTQKHPFWADTHPKLMKKVLDEDPEIPAGLSNDIKLVIKGCLAKDPTQRLTAPSLLEKLSFLLCSGSLHGGSQLDSSEPAVMESNPVKLTGTFDKIKVNSIYLLYRSKWESFLFLFSGKKRIQLHLGGFLSLSFFMLVLVIIFRWDSANQKDSASETPEPIFDSEISSHQHRVVHQESPNQSQEKSPNNSPYAYNPSNREEGFLTEILKPIFSVNREYKEAISSSIEFPPTDSEEVESPPSEIEMVERDDSHTGSEQSLSNVSPERVESPPTETEMIERDDSYTGFEQSLSNVPGNTPENAYNLGSFTGTKTFDGFVGNFERNNYYQLTVDESHDVELELFKMTQNADIEVYRAVQESDQSYSKGDRVYLSDNIRSEDDKISIRLVPGTYFIRVYAEKILGRGIASTTVSDTRYSLRIEVTPNSLQDLAGNTSENALDIGVLTGDLSLSDSVGNTDTHDYYIFTIEEVKDLRITVDNLEDEVDVRLYLARQNGDTTLVLGDRLESARGRRTDTRVIERTLGSGTYFIEIVPGYRRYSAGLTVETRYTLNFTVNY